MAPMNMKAHLEEQPPAKKVRIDDLKGQQQGSGESTGTGMNADEQKEELGTSTTTSMDLLSRPYRKLPAELDRQIFLCFNPATQLKFIWGLGWDFYDMFRHRLLIKSKRVRNPHGNRWNRTNTRATVADDGLSVSNTIGDSNVFAEQPYPITGPHCRVDEFPGTILYYYEVTGDLCNVGVSGGAIPADDADLWIGEYTNSYAFPTGFFYYECRLAGERRQFEFPEGATRPRRKHNIDNVFGCGLVLDSENKLCIFFTLNGKLMARKIPISPTVDRLFPAVTVMRDWDVSKNEANFGGDPAKPFKYDINNCPGLGLACI